MAIVKGIPYSKMTPEQREAAEAWADKWGSVPEKCPMSKSGQIRTNRKNVPHISDEDYEILTKHDKTLKLADITDKIREEYRESLKDLPSKEEMGRVKKVFASLRSKK